MNWRKKNVAVIGLGVSNIPLVRYLVRQGAQVTGCDKKNRSELGDRYDELIDLGATLQLGSEYLADLQRFDTLFLTPGLPKDLPEIIEARRAEIEISSETRLFFQRCKAPIVGVTGSAGKTTTTTLIGEILRADGQTVYVGGNIGHPLIEQVDQLPDDAWVVLELSSFQLELMDQSPHIALVTNVTPNHLDVHRSMEEYIRAKTAIFRYQTPDDWAVCNAQDETTQQMAASGLGRVASFGYDRPVKNGAFVRDDAIVLATGHSSETALTEVCAVSELPLLGRHNVENVAAALTVSKLCGASVHAMRDVIRTFTGVPHRLEKVGEASGIAFYNDSIATTPARAAAGLKAFDRPVVLIAGGYDKELDFDGLTKAVYEKESRAVVVLGTTADKIVTSLKAHAAATGRPQVPILRASSFEEAVHLATGAALRGDIVLLSPACASYDMFPNFEVRGNRFRELVQDIMARAAAQMG